MVASVDVVGLWRRIGNNVTINPRVPPLRWPRKRGSLMIVASVEAAPVFRNELLRFLCGE